MKLCLLPGNLSWLKSPSEKLSPLSETRMSHWWQTSVLFIDSRFCESSRTDMKEERDVQSKEIRLLLCRYRGSWLVHSHDNYYFHRPAQIEFEQHYFFGRFLAVKYRFSDDLWVMFLFVLGIFFFITLPEYEGVVWVENCYQSFCSANKRNSSRSPQQLIISCMVHWDKSMTA